MFRPRYCTQAIKRYANLDVFPCLSQRTISTKSAFINVSEEVQHALETNKPVVALETTIYTHGFPYPGNVALASHLESVVRVNGGVPATIGVLHGTVKVGFQPEELIELTSSSRKPETRKLSRRDLSTICGQGIVGRKLNGGTTVAGTMSLAHLAGIKVLATGGLGGVHQGGEDSMDISADLGELGRTPVAVISSGCKSFLDIPRTLEYLESQGVGVATFADGRVGCVEFPAFWTRNSGVPSPSTIQNEMEAAAIIYAQINLPLSSGLLFANPIPIEHSIPRSEMDAVVAKAIHEAQQYGASGRDNTPFILKRINDLTGDITVIANRALVEANVIRGTKVAVELAKLELNRYGTLQLTNSLGLIAKPEKPSKAKCYNLPSAKHFASSAVEDVDILVAGSLAIDLSCDYTPSSTPKLEASLTPQLYTSNPAKIMPSLGGVGQNVAAALHYLGVSVRLCSAIGADAAGTVALQMLVDRGLRTSEILTTSKSSRTAQYISFNDVKKDLVMAMADMSLLENDNCNFKVLWGSRLKRYKPKWLVVDANWSPSIMHDWIHAAKDLGAKIAFEPVSIEKSKRLFSSSDIPYNYIDLATPNELELEAMCDQAHRQSIRSTEWRQFMVECGLVNLRSEESDEKLSSCTSLSLVGRSIPQNALELLPFIPCILTKLGPEGVLLTEVLRSGDERLTSPSFAPYTWRNDEKSTAKSLDAIEGIYVRLFPAAQEVPEKEIISVNGVGDTFLGIIMAGLVTRERAKRIEDLILIAQQGSVMTLKSKESISPGISALRSLL